MNILKKEIAV